VKLKNSSSCIVGIFFLINLVVYSHPANIPDPETFFGHKPGADFKLIRWEKIYEYFQILGKNSDRVKIEDLGKTTMGNPFILAIISSPENLSNFARYREIAEKLAKGRISEEEAARLAKEGKTIALITCSMHASECGPTQMSPELGYSLATKSSPRIKEILDNVILLLIPSWNPDGNIMVVDWYRKNVGSPYETAPMPWLYHYYVGHDNNRDAFMNTQIETRYVNNILYHEWFPQIFMDMHHMGASDARLFLSPMYDPRHHSLDPLLTREIELTGAYMRTLLEEKGLMGVIHYANWNHWRMSAIHTCALWHNVTTILFEAAGTPLATPIYQTVRDLTGADSGGLGKKGNTQTINYPSPWPGGWWRLGDIVKYAYWSAIGFLEAGAKHKDKYLMNMYRMARNSIEKGRNEAPYAYIIPQVQRDPNTVAKMINILITDGAEIHQAEKSFQAQNREYPAETFVILMSQAYRPFLIDILGPQIYPDRRQYPGGPPEGTFDLTGWTLPYQMGVETIMVTFPFEAQLKPIEKAEPPAGEVRGQGNTYILDHSVLDSFRAINRLLKEGFNVSWATKSFSTGGKNYPAGAIIVAGPGINGKLRSLAKEFSLQIQAGSPPKDLMNLKPLKLGLYQPWTADMDEGWTRWIFDTWEFPYTTIHDAEIRNGGLKQKYDVIILTSISPQSIINGHKEGIVPSQYAGGIGKLGLASLAEFINEGGTLITLNASSELAVNHFKIPIQNVTNNFKSLEFFCPSAILKVEIDNTHPIGYGMDKTAAVMFYESPVFEFLKTEEMKSNEKDAWLSSYKVVARYPNGNPFMSGRLIGDQILYAKPALIEVDCGKGKIIMFGFRPQNRAQPHGTFKLFFNSLYYGPSVTSTR
jgi:hypothetical protein